MKILIATQFFNYCSGTSMYVLDLATELKNRGNEVTILSELGGEISNAAVKKGIKIVDFSQIFEIQDEKYDIMHLNSKPAADIALEFFRDTPAVMTLHGEYPSEVFESLFIKKYICVRPSIAEMHPNLPVEYVPDGIDFTRFNTKNAEGIKTVKEKSGLKTKVWVFTGSIDQYRSQAIRDAMNASIEEHNEFWVIGRSFLPFALPDPVRNIAETFFVEKWVEMSDMVVGTKIGRSAIEAWACGKTYLCYDIDDAGKVKGKIKIDPPEDMTQYDIVNVTNRIVEIYQDSIGQN